jgi:beta-lactamase class A
MEAALKRRKLIFGGIALGVLSSAAVAKSDAIGQLQGMEHRLSARIGVHAENLQTGRGFQHRPDERFAMCSTFKSSLAALCLRQADQGQLDLSEQLAFHASDMLPTSRVTSEHVSAGRMAIGELCRAIVEHSDNTAANLLLSRVGGPAAMTQFFRDIGDTTSRLDRIEMALNSNIPGDERDTTSPEAMAENLRQLIIATEQLTKPSQDLLVRWMRNEQNGQNRIRAAVPDDWIVANKPGTSLNGAANDIAVLWSPNSVPFIVTVFIDTQRGRTREAVASVREVADLALAMVS